MIDLKINGMVEIFNKEIPVIEGGFGEGQRTILAKTIAEIHEVELSYINRLVNHNFSRFKDVDLFDLKTNASKESVLDFGFTNAQYGNAKNIFILSERGYTKLVSMMDNSNDKKWEVMDKLVDDYFTMRKLLSDSEKKAQWLLQIYDGGQQAIGSAKELVDYEVNKVSAPLIEEIASVRVEVENTKKLIGLKSKHVYNLINLIKDKLYELKGYRVLADDVHYGTIRKRINLKYHVDKWEDIPVEYFGDIHVMIDSIESLNDIPYLR